MIHHRCAQAAQAAAFALAAFLGIPQSAYSYPRVLPAAAGCDAALWQPVPRRAAAPPSIRGDIVGESLTRTFTNGSSFVLRFKVSVPSADVLAWQIKEYSGATILSGASPVSGAGILSVPCTSTLAGYFALSAQLQSAGMSLAERGSRPHGIATFGVLPSVAAWLPSTPPQPLDDRRFGLQGTNFVDARVCCAGNGLQPVNENLGSSWVLDSRSEYNMEPDHSGQYDPDTEPLDVGFDKGQLARIVTLNGIPAYASTAPSATARGSYPPKSFAAFRNFTSRVGQESARVQAKLIPNQQYNYYQVTWEPDPGTPTQWMGTDEEFVELYQAAWNGAHATDPHARVMGPTTTSLPLCSQWLNRLAPLGFSRFLDAVSCHGYYALSASSATPPESSGLPAQMQLLRQTMTNLLPAGTKLFVTETGIAYPPGSQYSATFPTEEVLMQHAEAVVRTHIILLGEGADSSFLFYSADFSGQVGYGLYFNLSMPHPDFGSPDISPKPAAMAVAAATRLIDGSRTLGAIAAMPPGAFGYSFLLADAGHAVTALWAHDASFQDRVSYALTVDGPETNGSVAVFDAMGNPSVLHYSNGRVQLELSEMPTYVLSSNIGVLTPQVRAPQGYDQP